MSTLSAADWFVKCIGKLINNDSKFVVCVLIQTQRFLYLFQIKSRVAFQWTETFQSLTRGFYCETFAGTCQKFLEYPGHVRTSGKIRYLAEYQTVFYVDPTVVRTDDNAALLSCCNSTSWSGMTTSFCSPMLEYLKWYCWVSLPTFWLVSTCAVDYYTLVAAVQQKLNG